MTRTEATKPETKTAILPSQGYDDRRPTKHVYWSTIDALDSLGKPGWAHMFKCCETGALRRWGLDGTRLDSLDEDE